MSERITAYDVGVDDGYGHTYGVDGKKVAALLRLLADRIDSGQVISILYFKVLSQANEEDYSRTFLRMCFHEAVPR